MICVQYVVLGLYYIKYVNNIWPPDADNPQRTVAHCTWIKLLSMLLINLTSSCLEGQTEEDDDPAPCLSWELIFTDWDDRRSNIIYILNIIQTKHDVLQTNHRDSFPICAPMTSVLLGQRAAVYQKLTSQSEWIAVKPAPTRGLCQNSKRKFAKRKRNLWQRIQNPRFAKTNLWKSLTKNEAYLKSMLNLCDWVIFFRFHCVFLLL